MFIKTIKVKKPNLLAAAMLAGVICLLTILALTAFKFAKKGSYTLESEQQRQEFLKEMGWEVGAEFDECKQILIPEEFNEVYNCYNDLQKQQGFDLSGLCLIKICAAYSHSLIGTHSVPLCCANASHIRGDFLRRGQEASDQVIIHAAIHPQIRFGFSQGNQTHIQSLLSKSQGAEELPQLPFTISRSRRRPDR